MRTLIVWTLLGLIASCRPSQVQLTQIYLQQSLDSLQQASGITGISVAAILPDESLVAVSTGMADREKGEKLTPDHRLLLGSVGKLFVANLILREVERGTLKLDDPILPYFLKHESASQLPNIEQITVRQLLNHTSGLPRWVFKPQVWKTLLAEPEKVWALHDRLALIEGDTAVHAPGKGWSYSDTNYLLLGEMLEQMHPQFSFYEQVQNEILSLHALRDLHPSDQRELEGLAAGYTGERNPLGFPVKVAEEGMYIVNPQFERTGGGWMTTPSDLARYARLLYEGDLLSVEMKQAMQTTVPFATRLPGEATYGLACMVRETPLGKSLGHGGFMPGFQTELNHYPETGITLVLMVNEDQFGGNHPGPLIVWNDLIAQKVHQLLHADP